MYNDRIPFALKIDNLGICFVTFLVVKRYKSIKDHFNCFYFYRGMFL